MTAKKSTKKALLMSALSLLLCFSMLIGTTFAWFTDSVESLNNKIVAGNLDVELYNALPGNLNNDTKVEEGGLFEDITYWEPGVVAYENLTIANEGTLALKYALSVNFDNENTLNGYGLSDKLQVAFVPGGIEDGQLREKVLEAANKVGFDPMASFAQNGKLLPAEHAHITEIDKTGIPVGTITYAIVIYWEPSDDDNNWNANNQDTSDGKALHIDLGVNLFATQMVAEDDSFGADYDEQAEYVIGAGESSAYVGADIDGTVANYGNVTITDGSISQEGSQAFYNEGNAELKDVDLNMTGSTGYITNSRGDGSVTVFENVDATSTGGGVNVWEGEAIFKSGTVTTNSTSTSARHVFYVAAGGKLTIEEGTFTFSPTNLTRKGSYLVAHGAGAVINVYGGTFGKPSTRTAPVQEIDGGEVNIYGGTFAWDPSAWVADGYKAVESNGKYFVVDENVDGIITSAADLLALGGTKINGTYMLMADIDMAGHDMQPMEVSGGASVTFNGNSHTISNLKLGAAGIHGMTGAGNEVAGLFDLTAPATTVSLTVNDLTIKNADVSCNGYAAVIAGYNPNGGTTITLNDVDVAGATVTAETVAALVGYTTGTVNLTGCDVSGLILTGETGRPDKVGAFVGTANTATCAVTVTTCTNDTTYNDYGRVINGATWNGAVPVSSATALDSTLAQGGNAVLTDDLTFSADETTANSGYGATGVSVNGGVLDGNGHKLGISNWGTWDSAINITSGTIKNLTVNSGMRGIFINHNGTAGKVYLENVIIDGTVYTISCDQGTNSGLEAKNSTFNGWTSYAASIGNVKFTDCSFGSGQGYAFCRPYAPTEFIGCDFATGYQIDARAAVTFENCTINGVALTAENLETLVTSNISNATVK